MPNTLTPAEMGRRRWKGTTKEDRAKVGRAAADKRWEKKRLKDELAKKDSSSA